jgi:hypothetical protein
MPPPDILEAPTHNFQQSARAHRRPTRLDVDFPCSRNRLTVPPSVGHSSVNYVGRAIIYLSIYLSSWAT